ncbi:MAG TPA: hypothetical protein VF834_08425 [Streptosporangiaceae bacterium]
MDEILKDDALSKLSPAERRHLLRKLVDLERQSAAAAGTGWKWDAVLVVVVVSCIVLTGWIGYLAVTLPPYYRTGSWRGAWVGFDLALLASFAATGWTAWRHRQLLIISLVVLATLLLTDAWFDVVLDVRTAGFWESLTSALVIELPLAVVAITMARRLLRLTIGQIMRYEGVTGRVPPLWQVPLLGPTAGTPWRRLMQERARRRASAGAVVSRAAASVRATTKEKANADQPPPSKDAER